MPSHHRASSPYAGEFFSPHATPVRVRETAGWIDEAIIPNSNLSVPTRSARSLAILAAMLVPSIDAPSSVLSAAPVEVVRVPTGTHGIDLDGKLHEIGAVDGTNALVVVFLSVDCPIANSCLPDLRRLAKRPKVSLFGVISRSSTSRVKAVEHRKAFALDFPVLFDASGTLRRTLQPTHTPHAFVLDSAGRVRYSGAIDDRYAEVGRARVRAKERYLEDAVAAVLSRKRVGRPRTQPVGCLIEKPPSEKPTTDVTYARDIAPIVRAHCAACHRPGQRAPFSLLTFDDVSSHAGQIVEVVESGLMPPWKPVANHGEFRNQRVLSARERHLLRVWARNGKPRGDRVDEVAAATFSDGWQLGKPDVVLKMSEAFEIPADGPDLWQHFVFPSIVGRDRLVSAVEFRPGTPEVVHHASFFIDNSGAARKLDAIEPDYGYRGPGGGPLFRPNGVLRSWFPGACPHPLPEGMGRPLPRGSDLVVEIHYHPIGRVTRDQSEVGIHFAPRTARRLVEELQVLNTSLEIPAGRSEHRHRASVTVPVDVTLLDTAPHMHLLGKSMRAAATRPDGVVVPLVRVDDWDFNWQGCYVYREPVRLPAGSRIDVEFVYDNSKGNPQNPHSPPQRVTWGAGTNDEMGICHFQYTCDTLPNFFRMIRFNEAVISRQLNSHFDRRPEQADATRLPGG